MLYKRGKVLPSFSLFPSCPLCPELSSLRWRSKGCGDGLGYTCTCTHMYTCVYRIRTNWWRLLTGWLSVLPFLFFFFCPTVKRSRTRENNTTPEGYQPWRATDRDRSTRWRFAGFSIKRNFFFSLFLIFFSPCVRLSSFSHRLALRGMQSLLLLFPFFALIRHAFVQSLSSMQTFVTFQLCGRIWNVMLINVLIIHFKGIDRGSVISGWPVFGGT